MHVSQGIINAIDSRPQSFPRIGAIYQLVIGEYMSNFGPMFTGKVFSLLDGSDVLGNTFHDLNVTRLVSRLRKAMYLDMPEDEGLYTVIWTS